MALTPEETKYYDEMFDMFATPGWGRIVKDCEEAIEHFRTALEHTEDLVQLGRIQGEILQCRKLVYLRGAFEEALTAAQEVETDA